MNTQSSADIDLARRLERAEASSNASFVEARAETMPEVGARWTNVAGVYAMFDGVGSPLTQTFGLGLYDSFLEPQYEQVESFFRALGSATLHEVSSLAPDATTSLLKPRGYTTVEESVVLVRPTAIDATTATGISVRQLGPNDRAEWARLSADGWRSEGDAIADFVEGFGNIIARAKGVECFIAELNGQPIASAALNLQNGIALMAGASTVPSARGKGAQRALFEARLKYAASVGYETAMVVTQPGSGSMRNAERQGFRGVYTRTKWERPLEG